MTEQFPDDEAADHPKGHAIRVSALPVPSVSAAHLPILRLPSPEVTMAPAARAPSARLQRRADPARLMDGWHPARQLGPCPPDGIMVQLVLDNSSSTLWNAPAVSGRYTALSCALAELARQCTCRRCQVELIGFSPLNPSVASGVGPIPWTPAGFAAAQTWLSDPPRTASRLGDALHQLALEALPPGMSTLTLVLSDFDLDDPDPSRAYQQMATAHATAVVLGPHIPEGLVGVPRVQLTVGSPGSAAADVLVDGLATLRPPAPAKGTAAGRYRTARAQGPLLRWRHGWLLIALVVLLAGGVIIHEHPWTTARSTVAVAQPPIPAYVPPAGQPIAPAQQPVVGALAPIELPAPLGDVVRTTPAATVWIFDPTDAADPTTSKAIVTEGPVALEYQARYGLPSDTLTTGPHRPLSPVISSLDTLTATLTDHPDTTGTTTAALTQARQLLQPLQDTADRAVVIMTTDPDRWLSLLPDMNYINRTPAAHPEIRYYLIDLTGGTPPGDADLGGPGPRVLHADPRVRGQVATALARTFVDDIDARWPHPGS